METYLNSTAVQIQLCNKLNSDLPESSAKILITRMCCGLVYGCTANNLKKMQVSKMIPNSDKPENKFMSYIISHVYRK